MSAPLEQVALLPEKRTRVRLSPAFQPFFTQGLGFMAIVIAMLGRGRPLAVVGFSLMFGITLSINGPLQAVGHSLSPEVLHMLPFASIILALILFARRSYLPPALALPYVRGAR